VKTLEEAAKIKELRESAGMSRKEFSEHTGIPVRTLEDWEAARRTPPEYIPRLIMYQLKYEALVRVKEGYDAVIFDMDGIIFDSERVTMNCWLELASKYGIKNIEQPYLACIGTNMAKTKEIMLAAYGDDFPYDTYAKEASRMYHDKYDGGRLPMKKGVVELLKYLKKAGKKIALASSTRSETVIAQLKDADILDFFDAVLCGDMVERSKPAPDIFLRACQKLGTQPERTYGIEDSYNGIKALHAGKLRPIMVPDLLPCNEEMQEMTEAVLDSLLNVMEYLEKKDASHDK
jgi:HAD superfamily hydrolase (TIGR01509 family)